MHLRSARFIANDLPRLKPNKNFSLVLPYATSAVFYTGSMLLAL